MHLQNILTKKKDASDVKKTWLDTLSDLNVASQKGLVEMFDSSIGAGSVLMPYGGKIPADRDTDDDRKSSQY